MLKRCCLLPSLHQRHPAQSSRNPVDQSKSSSKTNSISTSAWRSIQHKHKPTRRRSRGRQIIPFRIQSTADTLRRTRHILRVRRRSGRRNSLHRPHQPRLRYSSRGCPPRRRRGTRYIHSRIRNLWFTFANSIVCTATNVVFRTSVRAVAVRGATVVWPADGLAVYECVERADSAGGLEEHGGRPAVRV